MVNVCGISAAESNRVSLRYIEEDTACWSVTPTTGTTRELRITSSSLTANKETQISDEIRADRMVSNIIEVGASSGGEIDFEMSVGSFDDFFEAFLGGTWTTDMGFDRFSGSSVSITDATVGAPIITVAGGDFTDYFTATQIVKTEGFLEDVNNRYWTVASAAFAGGNTEITMAAVTTAPIVEAGNAFGVIMDANDVLVRDTNIRAGTAGANAFDSNGTNAFAAAIAAGDLLVGQRVSVEGLGYEEGMVEVTTNPADGELLTLTDGDKTIVLEFDNDDAFTRGNVQVTIGGTVLATAENIRAAVNEQLNQGKIQMYASDDGVDTVTLVSFRDMAGTAASVITDGTGGDLTITAFTGYTDSYGVYTIASLTDDVITVEETVKTNANAGALLVTVKGSHLRNPGDLTAITRRSFSIETAFNDVNQFFVQTGMRVGSFTLSVAAGEIVTGQFALEGKETSTRTTTLLNAAPYDPLASTTTEVLNATVNIGEVRKDGTVLTTGIQSVELNGDAGLRLQPGISSRFPIGIGLGRFNLTGSLQAYFETLELYDNFLNHDTIGLSFDFQDNDDNFMTFTLPALKLTADPVAPGGIDQDIIEEIEFAAQRDPILNTMMMIDRMSSLEPAMLRAL